VLMASTRVAICLLIGALVLCVAQTRPNISETFEGEGYSHIVTVNETIWGIGHWAIDEPTGRSIEFWEYTIEHHHRNIHYLKRYDLGAEYEIAYDARVPAHCRKTAVKPPMPPNWAWVKNATYAGKRVIDGSRYDEWRYIVAGIELSVAVSETNASRPHYFHHRSVVEHRQYHFLSWHTRKPNDTWFAIPAICKNATIGEVDNDDHTIVTDEVCEAAAITARTIVAKSNGLSGESLIGKSMSRSGVMLGNMNIVEMHSAGAPCAGGPRISDVFFIGTPPTNAAMYLGKNEFALCNDGTCNIAPLGSFAFDGGCRRFC